MTNLSNLLSMQTAIGFLLAIGLWLLSKAVDAILEYFLHRKVFATIRREIIWRVRAFRTRFDPLSSTFQVSYSPKNNVTVNEGKNLVEQSLNLCQKKSKQRILSEEVSWGDSSNIGNVEIRHVDSSKGFQFAIHLVEDTADLEKRPGTAPENRFISKISFEIEFNFAYRELSDTIANLGTVISFLAESLDEVIGGTTSRGQFVIRPMEGGLTLDEWIEEEGFDVSMLLADNDSQKTQVEFFSDRAEVRPPYLKMDSEIRRYLNILILDYYLKKRSS